MAHFIELSPTFSEFYIPISFFLFRFKKRISFITRKVTRQYFPVLTESRWSGRQNRQPSETQTFPKVGTLAATRDQKPNEHFSGSSPQSGLLSHVPNPFPSLSSFYIKLLR